MSHQNMEKDYSGKTEEKLLEELRKESGLPLSLEEGAVLDDEGRQRLSELIMSIKSASDKDAVLIRFLTGAAEKDELSRAFPRFFRAVSGENAQFSVFLIRTENEKGSGDPVFSVLSGLFPAPKNLISKVNDKTFVVAASGIDEDASDIAFMISDTLSSEALTAVRVGYDNKKCSLELMPQAFSNARSAILIADMFSLEDACVAYGDLGLSKLLSKVPKEDCSRYLEEEFQGFDFSTISSETMNTINTLFEKGLNISEAARELYVHRNTLVYRIEKFEHDSGLDLRDFDDAVRCKIGLLLSKRLT